MLIDVQDPVRNLVLNVCFGAIALIALLAIMPWGTFGARTMSRLAVWLPVPLLILAVAYEKAMPSRFDIRVDLILLLPAYAAVLLATLARLLGRRRGRRRDSRDYSDGPAAVG
jgi:DNA-binding LytR/AlgR family response regulator